MRAVDYVLGALECAICSRSGGFRDKPTAVRLYSAHDISAQNVEPPDRPLMPAIVKPIRLTMAEMQAAGNEPTLSLEQTKWRRLADFAVSEPGRLGGSSKPVCEARYSRMDAAQPGALVLGCSAIYFVDGSGKRTVMLERSGKLAKVYTYTASYDGQRSHKKDDEGTAVYAYAEIVSSSAFGTTSQIGLDFKRFTAESARSKPYLLATMLCGKSISTGRRDRLEVIVQPASSKGDVVVETLVARITEVSHTEVAGAAWQRPLNNVYSIELAAGADPLAIVVLAVACDKALDRYATTEGVM